MSENIFNLDEAVEVQPRFEFSFGGELFSCVSPSETDIRRMKANMESWQDDPANFLLWLIGEDGWERLERLPQTFSIQHMNALQEAWAKFYEVDLPKSSTSETSTKITRMS